MDIREEFFEWICDIVDGQDYRKLLGIMYNESFYAIIPLDENRIVDGCELRYRFAADREIPIDFINDNMDPDDCSILEMMLGLAFRIEETIMEDIDFGDRTSMWFWIMVKSLGLYEMRDNNFDAPYVINTLDTFLTRGYSPEGHGGLFVVKDVNKDMRDVDIWYQMCMFFDNLL